MIETVAKVGPNLDLIRAAIDDFREQDKNARYMDRETFNRLKKNIQSEKRLEALPLCYLNKSGKAEIISGHHRIRAARAAGLSTIYALLDTRDLPTDKIKAKQLAHNSIAGKDDPQTLAEIYNEIQDVDARLEAYIDIDSLGLTDSAVMVKQLDIDFQFKEVKILFLSSQFKKFEKVLSLLNKQKPDKPVYVACGLETCKKLSNAVKKVRKNYDIKNIASCIDKMCDIILEKVD